MERLYQMWLAHPCAAWTALGVVALLVEAGARSGWLVWIAAAALATAAVTTLGLRDDIGLQWALFVSAAIAATWLGRRHLGRRQAAPAE